MSRTGRRLARRRREKIGVTCGIASCCDRSFGYDTGHPEATQINGVGCFGKHPYITRENISGVDPRDPPRLVLGYFVGDLKDNFGCFGALMFDIDAGSGIGNFHTLKVIVFNWSVVVRFEVFNNGCRIIVETFQDNA